MVNRLSLLTCLLLVLALTLVVALTLFLAFSRRERRWLFVPALLRRFDPL